jgi:16S rRNA (uracil1498-N3)-methyltransferase
MHRFFISKENISGTAALIKGDDAHHIQKVLRLKPGEEIVLCDGRGMDYVVEIQSMEKGRVFGQVIGTRPALTEPRTKVTLIQGLPKGSKMEVVIQKCVELGVYRIVPAYTTRAVVRIEDEKSADKKLLRWQRIAEEAAKQSQRGIVPEISQLLSFTEAVNNIKASLKLILWEGEKEQSLRRVLQSYPGKPDSIAILVGPEGGLDVGEIELAREHGWISVTLGPRILRTETAGMAVLSAIMYAMEDME